MKQLIQELRGEHEVILNKIDELERMLAAGETPDVNEFVAFFQTYVEERHHSKEEGQLFPRMREDPFLRDMADALLEEHNDARRMVELMRTGGNAASLLSIYAQNLRWHIAKEDSMIFQSAEHALS